MILEYKNVNGSLVKITDAERLELEAEEQRIAVIKEQEIAQQETKEALRQSMITKLAATLTPEETALLEELL
jgi:hypothetical protein